MRAFAFLVTDRQHGFSAACVCTLRESEERLNHSLYLSDHHTRWQLDNGLQVVCEPLPDLATVSVGIWMHTGSMMEHPEEEGLAHFMEHMAFKGTESRSTMRIAEETDLLGGHLNACTTKDYTCYYNKVIAEDLTASLELMGDLLLHPALLKDEMLRECSVICDEIAMDEDDPESFINELLYRAQFRGTCAEHPILGSREQILAYTPDSLRAFRQRHYTPDRCTISVCGQYDETQLREDIQRIFGSWQGKSQPCVPTLTPKDGCRVFLDRDLEQMHLCLGYPSFPYGHPDMFAMEMLNSILGASASARLFQRIRESLGLAYTVYSYNAPVEGNGNFCLYAACSPQNSRRVLHEMQLVFQQLAENGISAEEFEQTRKMLRVNFLMGLESPGSRMMSAGHSVCIANTVHTSAEALEKIEGVTVDSVIQLARKLISHEPSIAVTGRDASRWEESI